MSGELEQGLVQLVESLDAPVPLASARERLLAALGPLRFVPFAGDVCRSFGLSLEDAQQALRRITEPGCSMPGAHPHSRLWTTPSLQRASAIITELPASTRIAHHRHSMRELTYVLDGALIENGERHHQTGALLDYAPGSAHELVVSADGPCLVVFALRPE